MTQPAYPATDITPNPGVSGGGRSGGGGPLSHLRNLWSTTHGRIMLAAVVALSVVAYVVVRSRFASTSTTSTAGVATSVDSTTDTTDPTALGTTQDYTDSGDVPDGGFDFSSGTSGGTDTSTDTSTGSPLGAVDNPVNVVVDSLPIAPGPGTTQPAISTDPDAGDTSPAAPTPSPAAPVVAAPAPAPTPAPKPAAPARPAGAPAGWKPGDNWYFQNGKVIGFINDQGNIAQNVPRPKAGTPIH